MADQEPTDRLNEGERQILRLLGEGHTAKSIAATLDLSVNAVNERLREARRKTGAASSRELARTLRLQEIGDKQIGLPTPGHPGAAPVAPGATMTARWMDHRSVLAMIIVAAAGVGALLLAQAPSGSAAGGERIEGPVRITLAPDGQRTIRHVPPSEEQMRRESVDPAWAPAMEQQLKTIYASFDGYKVNGVRCATTLCAVDISSVPSRQVDFMGEMASPEMHKRFAAAGVSMTGFKVGPSASDPSDRNYTVWMLRKTQF